MPIYEYEPDDRECLMCDGRVDVIQGIDDPPFKYCPFCGMDVVRVVSRVNINLKSGVDPEKVAKKGFSTFRKLEKGKWEKVAGPDQDSAEPPPKDGILDVTNDSD